MCFAPSTDTHAFALGLWVQCTAHTVRLGTHTTSVVCGICRYTTCPIKQGDVLVQEAPLLLSHDQPPLAVFAKIPSADTTVSMPAGTRVLCAAAIPFGSATAPHGRGTFANGTAAVLLTGRQ